MFLIKYLLGTQHIQYSNFCMFFKKYLKISFSNVAQFQRTLAHWCFQAPVGNWNMSETTKTLIFINVFDNWGHSMKTNISFRYEKLNKNALTTTPVIAITKGRKHQHQLQQQQQQQKKKTEQQ